MDERQNNRDADNAPKPVSQRKLGSVVKDVYDIMAFGKRVYNNRAVISRRVSALSLAVGLISALIYITYVIFAGLGGKLSLNLQVVSIVLISAYAAVILGICIAAFCSRGAKTARAKVINRVIKIFRYLTKLLSLAISITCLVMSVNSGSQSAAGIAADTIIIIIAVLVAVLQGVLLICGGVSGIVRWLISPVKRRVKFNAVAMEWYRLVACGDDIKGVAGKVSKKYIDDIGAVLDGAFIPDLGKKYIGAITSEDITLTLGGLSPELLPVGEGVAKNLFAYACECGYISQNPCAALGLEGSVNDEKPAAGKGISKVVGAAKGKIGRGIAGLLNSAFDSLVTDDDE